MSSGSAEVHTPRGIDPGDAPEEELWTLTCDCGATAEGQPRELRDQGWTWSWEREELESSDDTQLYKISSSAICESCQAAPDEDQEDDVEPWDKPRQEASVLGYLDEGGGPS